MVSIMSQAWKIVNQHVPLIRFRKGGSVTRILGETAAKASPTSSGKSQQRPLLEDYELPPRYKRQLLDEKEINAINSGGAY